MNEQWSLGGVKLQKRRQGFSGMFKWGSDANDEWLTPNKMYVQFIETIVQCNKSNSKNEERQVIKMSQKYGWI